MDLLKRSSRFSRVFCPGDGFTKSIFAFYGIVGSKKKHKLSNRHKVPDQEGSHRFPSHFLWLSDHQSSLNPSRQLLLQNPLWRKLSRDPVAMSSQQWTARHLRPVIGRPVIRIFRICQAFPSACSEISKSSQQTFLRTLGPIFRADREN